MLAAAAACVQALSSAASAYAQAHASTATERVRVELAVEAEAGCATAAGLAGQVQARSPRIDVVDGEAGVPRVVVAVLGADEGGARTARLTVQWPDGRSAERSLTAGSCDAAVEALALLVAMTLDPSATGEAAAGIDEAADEAAPEAEPRARDEPARRDDAGEPGGHVLAVEHVALGVGAQLVSGPAPRAMPGIGLYARLSLRGAGVWAPALRLQLLRTWVDDLEQAGGVADFALDVGELDACPLGARYGALSTQACASLALGRLTARGAGSYLPQTHHEPWGSVGGRILATLALFEVAELHAGVGLARPLDRYRFAFRPEVFHQVAGLCLAGHLGVGVRFP